MKLERIAASAASLLTLLAAMPAALAQSGALSDEQGVASVAHALKETHRAYLGWRLFQENCARCHGPDALGTKQAPDLLERVKTLSETRFIGIVLRRYSWVLSGEEAGSESAARESLVQGIIDREKGEVKMPAWEGEPSVVAHLDDLYQFLKARSDGTLGPERPSWPGK